MHVCKLYDSSATIGVRPLQSMRSIQYNNYDNRQYIHTIKSPVLAFKLQPLASDSRCRDDGSLVTASAVVWPPQLSSAVAVSSGSRSAFVSGSVPVPGSVPGSVSVPASLYLSFSSNRAI